MLLINRNTSKTLFKCSMHLATLTNFSLLGCQIRGTFLTVPIKLTISKRFGGNKNSNGLGGKLGGVGKGTPIKPSSLAKPLPPIPKPMSPKYNNNKNVGVMKPMAFYDSSKDSYLAKSGVAYAIQELKEKQANYAKSTQPHPPKANSALASTTTSEIKSTQSSSNINTTTNTSGNQPLSSTTGALVVYKPKPKDPVTLPYSNSTIFINSYGIAFLDHSQTSLPPIPPLPPKPIAHTTPAESVYPITAEALQNAKNKLKPFIPLDTKIPDVSNKTPEVISEKITELANKLSHEDITKEMLGRGLFTKDNAMSIEVMTVTGEIIKIGQGTQYKLSAFGYGHYKQANVSSYMENIIQDNFNIYVGVLKNDKVKFQSAAENKHMLLFFRKNDQNWYSLGYLTSQPTETKLGNMQFKAFQDINYRGLIPKNPDKPQYLALYKNAKKVSEDQIILLKGGADYFVFIEQTKIINKICETLMGKAFVNYNPEGVTVEQCIATCIHFDTVIRKKLSHPQTNADILNSAQMATKKNKIKSVTDESIPE